MRLAKVQSLRQKKKVPLVLAAVLLLTSVALQSTAPAVAQSGNGYDLTWNTVDGGGLTFRAGGNYTLGGTIGQPDAGALTGGDYTLGGGFWTGRAVEEHRIYLPLVLKNFS